MDYLQTSSAFWPKSTLQNLKMHIQVWVFLSFKNRGTCILFMKTEILKRPILQGEWIHPDLSLDWTTILQEGNNF